MKGLHCAKEKKDNSGIGGSIFTIKVIVDGIFLLIFFLIVTHFYVKINTWIGQALYLT